jgi:hypothetical protein
MGVVSAKHLTEALQQAKAVGLVEEKFKVGDCEVVLRNLRPDEYEAVVQECKDLEDLAYLNKWQEGHVCRSIVEINGVDLREADFVEVEEPDPKNRAQMRTVKREVHDWLRKNVLATWSKEAIFTAYRKFTDAVQLAENKAKEGVHFVVAEESAEEKYRRILGELKELEAEVPPPILEAILHENGYTFYTTPQDTEMLREFDQRHSDPQPAPAAEAPQAAPPPVQAPAPTPTRGPVAEKADPIQNVANIMRQRVPMNQQPVPIPEMPKAPIEVREPATSAPQYVSPPPVAPPAMTGPPVVAGRIPAEAAMIDEALRAAPPQAVIPPGMVAPPNAPPGTFVSPAERAPTPVLAQRGQQHTDPRGLASILEPRPAGGINPKFRPQR